MSTPKTSNKRPSRDTVTTINRDGSRFFLHPADVRGRWTVLRRLVALVLIGVYALLPWIPVNGYPAVFLDVTQRRFHLFGLTLAAQDVWLLFFLVTGLAFTLFFLTAFVGRVWCGWACPQTVFLDHVYRRIERLIEGDAAARKALDKAPLDNTKIAKRVLKHALYLLVSSAIAHMFLSYFVSIPQLWTWMTQAPGEHWSAFVFVSLVTGALYFNFAWFREQLCLIICPYGRLQSVLVDSHSVNVAYDAARGEPRGKGTLAEAGPGEPRTGDCIDCRRCVQVCPTGIDIRMGLQIECVACTACIDACDEIMDKVQRPRGLIRYASEEELGGRRPKYLRPRTLLYSVLLLIGAAVATFAFSRLDPVEATATRMPGPPFYVAAENVRNQFQVRLINKTTEPEHFRATLVGVPVGTALAGFEQAVVIAPMEESQHPLVVSVPRVGFAGDFAFTLRVTSERTGTQHDLLLRFVGPDPELLRR